MPGWRLAAVIRQRLPRGSLRLGWLLSVALHLAVIAGLTGYCRFVAVPAGGGGGGGGGCGGGGVLELDVSGLGAGAGGPCPEGDAAADGGVLPAAETESSPTPAQSPRRQDTAATSSGALPVLTAAAATVPETPSIGKPRKARKPRSCAVRPSTPTRMARPPAAEAARSHSRTDAPGMGAGGGASGHGGGTGGGNGSGSGTGTGPGQGSGSGGGVGEGRGPGIGPGQGPGGGGGMSLASVDEKPRILHQVEPDYPSEARRRRIEGRVVVRLLVTAEGGVERVGIVSAQPPEVFDQAVLAALRRWRFHPARFKGRDVATWVMLPIRFDLKP